MIRKLFPFCPGTDPVVHKCEEQSAKNARCPVEHNIIVVTPIPVSTERRRSACHKAEDHRLHRQIVPPVKAHVHETESVELFFYVRVHISDPVVNKEHIFHALFQRL